MPIISIYAAILTFLFIFLSIRTIRTRRGLKIAVGDGGNMQMLRAMRAHSNFAEYVPMALILIYCVESSQAPKILIHALGLCLLSGRAIHAFGVSQLKENFKFRVSGMMMTFASLIIASGYLVFCWITSF